MKKLIFCNLVKKIFFTGLLAENTSIRPYSCLKTSYKIIPTPKSTNFDALYQVWWIFLKIKLSTPLFKDFTIEV